MVVEGVLVSVAIGAITGGAGAVAGAGAVVARVAAQAPRFAAILNALRTAAATCASTVRAAHMRCEPPGEDFRSSSMWPGPGPPPAAKPEASTSPHSSRTGCAGMTMSVVTSSTPMPARPPRSCWTDCGPIRDFPTLSSFASQANAEQMLSRFLSTKVDDIEAWLTGHGRRLRLDGDLGSPTGISVTRAGDVFHVSGIRAILVRDPSMDDGFHVLTAFPQP